MPELPEVETVKRVIEPQIVGKRILSVDVLHQQIIAHPDAATFCERLAGTTIKGMSRRGKFLSLELEDGSQLFLHLRMTGQLLVTPKAYPVEKHTHLIAELSDESQIRYIDVRRFGRFWYLNKEEDASITGIDKLGIEPTSRELTADYLKSAAGKRKKPIKEVLHDQRIVAGIGNIYSDEILFAARVYPSKKCTDLTEDEWKRVAETIPEIIRWGIKANEMTAEEYLAGRGKEYRNTPHLKVYGQTGQACPVCGARFEKITIGGRSATYCPRCQAPV